MAATEEVSIDSPWPVRLAGAGIVAAAIAAYANAFSNKFVFLDVADIVDNPTIRHLGRIGTVISPPAAGGLTVGARPIVNLSLALNFALGGAGVWGYHAANLAFHVIAALALFGVVRRTALAMRPGGAEAAPRVGGGWVALKDEDAAFFGFVVALLWAVHPLQTEAVTYVIQRAESMMGMFYLLTLYCFIRYSMGRPVWGAFSVVFCLLGMGTKEVMASAPVMVLLYDRTFLSGSFREAWRRHRGVLLGLGATWIWVGALTIGAGERGGTAGFGIGVSWWSYLLTQFPAILHYLRLAVWPSPLVFDYAAEWVANPWSVLPAALVVIGLAAGSAYLLFGPGIGPAGRAVGYAGAFFFAILAPTSLIPGMSQTMAEHRMYLALAPVIAVVVAAVIRGSRRRPALLVVAALFLALTIHRNRDYRDNLTIWSDTVAKRPASARAHFNLGAALGDAGRRAEAIGELERALALNPNYPEAENQWGILLFKAGRYGEAAAHYREAVRLRPAYADAHCNLGTALAEMGRFAEAVPEFAETLRIRPDQAEAEDDFGASLGRMGRWPEAIAHFRRAILLEPDEAKFHYDLGNALNESGAPADSVPEYEAALRLRPDYAEAHTNLGAALAATDRLAEAIAHFQRAIAIAPRSINAHYNLGLALRDSGRDAEAETEFAEVNRLRAAGR